MKFGPASPADAMGGVTVHTLRQGSLVLKKGTTIGPAEVEALNKAGVAEIVVVRLEEGDVSEDEAAASIAKAVAGDGVNVERAFTGRANLFAARAGVLVVDRAAVDRINGVDEAITFATLSAFKPVVEGEMIATVKLIPFGVEAKLRDAAVAVAGKEALRIAPYVIKRVGIVSTLLPGLSPKVIEKTLRVTAERLAPAGATIIAERRVPHEEAALAASIKELLGLGAELVIVFGASADRRPPRRDPGGDHRNRRRHRAFRHAGRSRQPAADRQGRRRAGAGCARLRAFAGRERVRLGADASAGGAEGHARRPHRHGRRRPVDGNRHPAAAAHRSRYRGQPQRRRDRAGGRTLDANGRSQQAPRRTRRQEAGADRGRAGAGLEGSEVIVVTGHQAELVEQALAGLKVKFVRNPDFAGGLASSVKSGIAAVPDNADGAVVCLGDMPLIIGAIDRPPDRGLCARPRPPDRRARQRRPARQSRCCGRAASSGN